MKETPFLTAQQTSLVRAVIDPNYDLERAPAREPGTGRRSVPPLAAEEFSRFCSAWKEAPVRCIQSMNRAIAHYQVRATALGN